MPSSAEPSAVNPGWGQPGVNLRSPASRAFSAMTAGSSSSTTPESWKTFSVITPLTPGGAPPRHVSVVKTVMSYRSRSKGLDRYCLPRHRMPFKSRNEREQETCRNIPSCIRRTFISSRQVDIARSVSTTWQVIGGRSYPQHAPRLGLESNQKSVALLQRLHRRQPLGIQGVTAQVESESKMVAKL